MHFAYNSNFQGKGIKKKLYMQIFRGFGAGLAEGCAHLCEITQKAEHQASSNTISENWMHVYLDSTEREGEERELNLFQEKTDRHKTRHKTIKIRSVSRYTKIVLSKNSYLCIRYT